MSDPSGYGTPTFVNEGGIERSELSNLYADILADDLVADLDAYEKNPDPSLARGSTFDHLVETAGIEPAQGASRPATGRRGRRRGST